MLVEFKIPPGVYRNGTDYQSKGRWHLSDLIRWFEGTLRPLGGWRVLRGGAPRADLQVSGSPRGSWSWRSNDSERHLAIGTHTKLYSRTGSTAGLVDITPAGIVTGFADTQSNSGYGGGPYGYDTYGTPRSNTDLSQLATTWSMDNFGEFLVAVQSRDGKLYYWDLMTATAVQVIATFGTTPIDNIGVVVTDERFVMLLQANGNRRLVQWADQESLFNWDITATTQAGSFELQTQGEILLARRVRGQTLILTTVDAFIANYIGTPLVYGFERVGTGCGAISKRSCAVIDKAAMWMGAENFFIYDGYVKPVPCEVQDYVFSNINRAQVAKVWAIHNADFGEVTFYYPVSTEIDSYVTYNYREGHWAVGSMNRTTGVDNAVYSLPIRVKSDGYLYEHEVGNTYDSSMPFVESGPSEIGNGQNIYMVKEMYPDEKTQGDVQVSFATKFYPNATEYAYGPYTMANPTSMRLSGRQIAARITGVTASDWRAGTPRFDVEIGGMR